MRPRSRIVMAPSLCCRLHARCTPSSNVFSLTAPMPPTEWRPRPGSSSRSCASRLAKSALPFIPGAGWSNASLPGLGATAVWRRTSKGLSNRQQPSSMPLPSCCSRDDSLVRLEIRVGLLDPGATTLARAALLVAGVGDGIGLYAGEEMVVLGEQAGD